MTETLREHHDYLSDPVRLQRFESAIARVVRPGDTVADVGCGFGILGFLCLEAGAGHVWGIDRTDAIAIARETAAREGLGDRYTCLRATAQQAELPEPVDMVICDHVGYLGFDYGIIDMMGDARRRMLKPGGRIVPERIDLKIAAVSTQGGRALVDAWSGEAIPTAYRWLRGYAANAKYRFQFAPEEIVTAPAPLGTIDLTGEVPAQLAFTAELAFDRHSTIDGLAGWFDCEIAAGVRMTNSPLSPDRIARAQAFLPFADPLAVQAGDKLAVRISSRHEDEVIAWTATLGRTGEVRRQSTFAGMIVDSEEPSFGPDHVARLTPVGAARRDLLGLIDEGASVSDIEQAFASLGSEAFHTTAQVQRFVRSELRRNAR